MRWVRRTGVEILGWALVAVGIALLVLPGPGTLVLVAGVALLAPHYTWAQRVLDPLHDRAVEAARRSVRSRRSIAISAAVAMWLAVAGVLWLHGPTIPEADLLGLHVGPGLPGGRAAGFGLLSSGILAALLLAYSVHKYSTASPRE